MGNVLKKIPARRVVREKGRSICVIAAVFFTTVLFVAVFSTLFFAADAAEEMLRASAPILADAALSVTDAEYEKISQSPRVSEASFGIRLALTRDGREAVQLFACEDAMAQWMRCYPASGRMPQAGNEIVVSDQYLRGRGLTYKGEMPLTITYDLENESYTDTFTVTGVYEMSGQPLHVILTSKDFYRDICEKLRQREIDPADATYRMAGIVFASRGNVRRLMSLLIAEENLALDEESVFLNDASLFDGSGPGVLLALAGLLLAIIAVGYLFISNIFRICAPADARFCGRLSTNGVTKREIGALIRRQDRILFLAAAIPALPAGYVISCAALPGILNGYTTLHIQQRANPMIFALSLAFSYLTMRISERGPLRLAKNASPLEMKQYTGKFPRVKAADDRSCLGKLGVRHFRSDLCRVLKVCVSLALSILLSGAFYTVVAGFDEEEYVRDGLDADFRIAKKPVFTNPNLNLYSYERTQAEEIAPYKSLPGIRRSGGGSSSHVSLHPSAEVWDTFERIAGEGRYSTPGEMVTEVYGLDELLLEKLTAIDGTIDQKLLQTGDYVLLDPVLGIEDGNEKACYAPGETVTIPFMSGEEKTYTVMAVVAGLPYSLSLPGRYAASNLYLPRDEWLRREHRDDYYMYAFDVDKAYHEAWDETLARDTSGQESGIAYRSAKTAADDVHSYTDGLKLAGFLLGIILLSMGILNFVNCMAVGIYSRKREFAVLESMGLSERELSGLLVREGMLYMAGGLVPGVLLSIPLVSVLLERLLQAPYIRCHFYPSVYLLFAALLGAAAVLVPRVIYRIMERCESFPERIRSCRE